MSPEITGVFILTESFSLPAAPGEILSEVREDEREEQDDPSLLRLSLATVS